MNNILEKIIENPIVENFLLNPIWQWVWMIAMLFSILWYAQKDDKNVLRIFIVSNIAWMTHFFFMWTFSAMASCAVWVARSFLSLKYKRNKKIFLWVISATLVLWIMTFEGKLSILPIIASCVSAYWYFFFDRLKLRIFMFVSSLCWIIFSFWSFSIWWMITDSIVLVILIITMIKMIKEEWWKTYFRDKIFAILQRPKPDLWRFITIEDFIKMTHNSAKARFLNFKNIFKEKYKNLNSIKIYLFKDKKILKIEKELF